MVTVRSLAPGGVEAALAFEPDCVGTSTTREAYAAVVALAGTGNVEGFFRADGYEPTRALLQVHADEVPVDYVERVPIVDERAPEQGAALHRRRVRRVQRGPLGRTLCARALTR